MSRNCLRRPVRAGGFDTQAPFRLGILTSHPIQYQAPLFRRLASEPDIDLHVYFCSDAGATEYWDDGFGQTLRWDVPLLDGYDWTVLENFGGKADQSRFTGLFNPGIVNRIRQDRLDALVVRGWGHATELLAVMTALRRHVPYMIWGETTLQGRPSPWLSGWKARVVGAIVQNAHAVLPIGRHSIEFYRAFGVADDAMFLAPYAVDNAFFMRAAQDRATHRRSVRERLAIPVDMPIILFAGKLIDRKRPAELLRAYARSSMQDRAALVFAGNGIEYSYLKELVTTLKLVNVRFLGFQPQHALTSIYCASDLLALPSRFETWGLVLNEAMSCGLPVIASAGVGAAVDLISNGENGYVYEPGDVDALARGLAAILGDDGKRHRMGEASQARIRSWSYEENVAAFGAAIEHVRATSAIARR